MADDRIVFDRKLVRSRQMRALSTAPEFLFSAAADALVDRLDFILRDFDLAIDLASPGGLLARKLTMLPRVGQVFRLAETGTPDAVADAEALPLARQSVALIVSSLGLSTVNDLPGALVQARQALKPDGLFLATVFGPQTLTELRQSFLAAEAESGDVNPHIAPFPDVREAGGLLQRAGLALPVVDAETLTVRYDTPFDLMADLRAMALTNALVQRDRRPMRRDVLQRMARHYAETFSDPDGRVRASFEFVYLSGWAPHESQQKPLKPGSARARLADALSTVEKSAGEKAGE